MKFRFCGDRDCPDWLLAEMNTLAKLTSVKTRLISNKIVEEISQGHDDWDLSEVEKLSADARLSRDEVLAVVGALAFVFKSAAKHDVSSDVLDAELQQLGLPKEHSASVSRVFSTQNAKLRQSLCLGSLKLTRNVEVAECGVESVPTTKGNMEMVKLAISYSSNSLEPSLDVFLMTKLDFCRLLSNLREAQKTMQVLEGEA